MTVQMWCDGPRSANFHRNEVVVGFLQQARTLESAQHALMLGGTILAEP